MRCSRAEDFRDPLPQYQAGHSARAFVMGFVDELYVSPRRGETSGPERMELHGHMLHICSSHEPRSAALIAELSITRVARGQEQDCARERQDLFHLNESFIVRLMRKHNRRFLPDV